MKIIKCSLFWLMPLILTILSCTSKEQIIPLWPHGQIPNHIETNIQEAHEQTDILRIKNVQEPTLEVFLANDAIATGKAMLIFPGGGYGILAYDWEGTDVAKYLNSHGIAGIVVKYRLPSDKTQTEKEKVPLIDAQRAMRLVRSRAQEWNIDTNQIGIIGFSAGGHLASTLGTQFKRKLYEPIDSADNLSARPDYMALIYPVITMGNHTHQGSKRNLLGKDPSKEMVNKYSSQLQVNNDTPATFLVHAIDDEVVPRENSEYFHGILSTTTNSKSLLYLYDEGGHGFGLALQHPQLSSWTKRMLEWMDSLE